MKLFINVFSTLNLAFLSGGIALACCIIIAGCASSVSKPTPAAQKTIYFGKDTLFLNDLYSDTIHADSLSFGRDKSSHITYTLVDSGKGMSLEDSIFSWTPNDTCLAQVTILACNGSGPCDTIRGSFHAVFSLPDSAGCPSYTKKDNILGQQWNLPSGFFVFAYTFEAQISGLFLSKINKFQPSLIPNTKFDQSRSIGISQNGNWILYVTGYKPFLITRDGSKKVPVPTKNSVDMAEFYRNGPYGDEICYTGTDGRPIIRSVQVNLDSTPVFGNDRIIADLTGKFRIERYYTFSVSRDEILGAFTLLYQDTTRLRMGFLTIPDGGRGIAGPDNMYKWKNDDSRQFWGCNSSLSHDGGLSLYIGGAAGFVEPFNSCLPPEHQGFVVTPFRRDSDPPIGIDEHIDRYAISINWCPQEYRFGEWSEMDFHAWYFGNRNDYVIGCQTGSLSPIKALWLVDWQQNSWTMLTPPDSLISVDQGGAAVFFSDSFSMIDDGNPNYRVIYPNGGEIFKVGQQCTVKVASQRDGNAGVKISLQNGLYSFMLPSITHAINPYVDSTVIFSIPETFALKRYNQTLGAVEEIPISTISDSCRICVQDYNATNGFGDCSMGFFKIRAKE